MSCDCITGINNTGVYKCAEEIMKDAVGVLIVPLVANDGTVNQIDIANDTPNASFFSDKINQSDASKRWYPVMGLEAVTEAFEDSLTEDFPSGRSEFLQNGSHTWESFLVGVPLTIISSFKSARCVDHGVYIIDSDGKLSGERTVDGLFMKPYKVVKGSIDAVPVPAVAGTNVQKVKFSFEFDRLILMENTVVITKSSMTDVDLTTINGLLDVTAIITLITTTSFTATLVLTDFGDYQRGTASGIPAEGWVITDFTLVEVSPSPGPIVITTVTESAPGVYDFVIPAATSSDVLELDSAVSAGLFVKTGHQLPDTIVTIP